MRHADLASRQRAGRTPTGASGSLPSVQGAIAGRYPLVEATVELRFAAVALPEVYDPLDPIDRGQSLFCASLLYHWLLVALPVTVGLIEYDRRPEPALLGLGGSEFVIARHREAIALGLLTTFGVLLSFVATSDGRGTVLNPGLLAVFFRSLR